MKIDFTKINANISKKISLRACASVFVIQAAVFGFQVSNVMAGKLEDWLQDQKGIGAESARYAATSASGAKITGAELSQNLKKAQSLVATYGKETAESLFSRFNVASARPVKLTEAEEAAEKEALIKEGANALAKKLELNPAERADQEVARLMFLAHTSKNVIPDVKWVECARQVVEFFKAEQDAGRVKAFISLKSLNEAQVSDVTVARVNMYADASEEDKPVLVHVFKANISSAGDDAEHIAALQNFRGQGFSIAEVTKEMLVAHLGAIDEDAKKAVAKLAKLKLHTAHLADPHLLDVTATCMRLGFADAQLKGAIDFYYTQEAIIKGGRNRELTEREQRRLKADTLLFRINPAFLGNGELQDIVDGLLQNNVKPEKITEAVLRTLSKPDLAGGVFIPTMVNLGLNLESEPVVRALTALNTAYDKLGANWLQLTKAHVDACVNAVVAKNEDKVVALSFASALMNDVSEAVVTALQTLSEKGMPRDREMIKTYITLYNAQDANKAAVLKASQLGVDPADKEALTAVRTLLEQGVAEDMVNPQTLGLYLAPLHWKANPDDKEAVQAHKEELDRYRAAVVNVLKLNAELEAHDVRQFVSAAEFLLEAKQSITAEKLNFLAGFNANDQKLRVALMSIGADYENPNRRVENIVQEMLDYQIGFSQITQDAVKESAAARNMDGRRVVLDLLKIGQPLTLENKAIMAELRGLNFSKAQFEAYLKLSPEARKEERVIERLFGGDNDNRLIYEGVVKDLLAAQVPEEYIDWDLVGTLDSIDSDPKAITLLARYNIGYRDVDSIKAAGDLVKAKLDKTVTREQVLRYIGHNIANRPVDLLLLKAQKDPTDANFIAAKKFVDLQAGAVVKANPALIDTVARAGTDAIAFQSILLAKAGFEINAENLTTIQALWFRMSMDQITPDVVKAYFGVNNADANAEELKEGIRIFAARGITSKEGLALAFDLNQKGVGAHLITKETADAYGRERTDEGRAQVIGLAQLNLEVTDATLSAIKSLTAQAIPLGNLGQNDVTSYVRALEADEIATAAAREAAAREAAARAAAPANDGAPVPAAAVVAPVAPAPVKANRDAVVALIKGRIAGHNGLDVSEEDHVRAAVTLLNFGVPAVDPRRFSGYVSSYYDAAAAAKQGILVLAKLGQKLNQDNKDAVRRLLGNNAPESITAELLTAELERAVD